MNAEQKERAIQLITTWRTRSITTRPDESAVYGDCMTDILQELVGAPAPEPVARVTGYYAGYLSIATVDGRVLPAGTALYAAPPHQSEHHLEMVNTPAPSVPDVAQTIPSHDQITQILNGLDRCGVAESKRAFLRTWIRDWTAHKLSAAPTPAEAPADVARDAWYGSNPPSLFQATAIYMALLEAAQNPRKLSDERILELFYEHATPDRWPFGFARAIDAAMREKGGAWCLNRSES